MDKKYEFYSDPFKLFSAMIKDIENAEKSILLETYIFDNDHIGVRFRDTLIKAVKRGVEVKLLVDSWGGSATPMFFKSLVEAGAQVRFFRKLKLKINFITFNHKRDHRKLLIIDNDISYLGSTNLTNACINWREMTIRIKGPIANAFTKAFFDNYEIYNKRIYNKRKHLRPIFYENFEIIRDIPSSRFQPTRNRHIDLIRSAESEIIIETPFFIPDTKLIKTLIKAARRGVHITLLVPYNSDVRIADILREMYFGKLYRNNIKILIYMPSILHSKLLLVDNKYFIIGTANLDYRSFRHQFDIGIFGTDIEIISGLNRHFNQGISQCKPFDYTQWKNRPLMQRIMERILRMFRYLM